MEALENFNSCWKTNAKNLERQKIDIKAILIMKERREFNLRINW